MNSMYDVIVVGGGHAGCEAALAAARLDVTTVLVVSSRTGLASMPCNPSIGAIAKSHIVAEIDALGGEMARNADYTGLQWRTLNTRKGPAVQAVRVQCDKELYSMRMARVIAMQRGLEVIEGSVVDVLVSDGNATGVRLGDGSVIVGRRVVLAPGTFLHGRIHIGDRTTPGGRRDERSADDLGDCLRRLGFRMGRLKTGTPPRLLGDSVDYSVMEAQPGEDPAPFLSWCARHDVTGMFHVEHQDQALRPWPPGTDQMPCYITRTTEITHDIIRRNLKRSALYGGYITGTGVRYCPSVEDKIVKFSEKTSHHVFIEPEGRKSNLVYPNGISNSLPQDVQLEMVHSIPGLGRAKVEHWGYAIEYDFSDPMQLQHSLETKLVKNLYFTGQINGTTGYEEAAAQGLIAGVNAALSVQNKPCFTLTRADAYIGVLIDDLVTKGTDEPYRMLTSRAEHRLLLRQDNAGFRLLPHAKRLGLTLTEQIRETEEMLRQIDGELRRLRNTYSGGVTLAGILLRPGASYADICQDRSMPHAEVVRQVEIALKYEGYIAREHEQIEKAKALADACLPKALDYWSLSGLRTEAREKLSRVQPVDIGQASRIPGVTSADIALLSVYARRGLGDRA